jgi:hypothetical protein
MQLHSNGVELQGSDVLELTESSWQRLSPVDDASGNAFQNCIEVGTAFSVDFKINFENQAVLL